MRILGFLLWCSLSYASSVISYTGGSAGGFLNPRPPVLISSGTCGPVAGPADCEVSGSSWYAGYQSYAVGTYSTKVDTSLPRVEASADSSVGEWSAATDTNLPGVWMSGGAAINYQDSWLFPGTGTGTLYVTLEWSMYSDSDMGSRGDTCVLFAYAGESMVGGPPNGNGGTYCQWWDDNHLAFPMTFSFPLTFGEPASVEMAAGAAFGAQGHEHGHSDAWIKVDSVQAVAPEPDTLAFGVGGGLCLIAWFLRRKKGLKFKA
jgi:hypothetical protein